MSFGTTARFRSNDIRGMKHFTFENQWDSIKGQLKQRFAQLTDDDLAFVAGKGEELLARLREKLALSSEELNALLAFFPRQLQICEQFRGREHALWQQAARVEIGHAERLCRDKRFSRVG